jgi:hypothetical protein
MTPSPFDISSSVTTWPHIHTSRIACKSLVFRFLPKRVAGPSRMNGWSALPSVSTAKSAVGGPLTWVLGEARASTSGPGGNSCGDRGSGECWLSRAMLHLSLSSRSNSGVSKGLSWSRYSGLPAQSSLLSWYPKISPSKPSSFSGSLASSSPLPWSP